MPYDGTLPTSLTADTPLSKDRINAMLSDIWYALNGKVATPIKRSNGGDYTTSSATFVDIDSTNLAVTITVNTGRVRLTLMGTFYADAASRQMSVDFTDNGTRFNSGYTNGLASETMDANSRALVFTDIKTGLTPGSSHTFKPQWLVGSGTAKLRSNTTQEVVTFMVEEI